MSRRIATLLAAIAAAAMATAVQAGDSRARQLLIDPHPHGVGVLYARWPSIAADYTTAMMRYRMATEYEDLPPRTYPFVMFSHPPLGGPWTWTATNGSHARRLKDGALRISLTDQLGNWFVEILCADSGWPVFSCSDGVQRIAAAPEPHMLVIDGVEFVRALPVQADP